MSANVIAENQTAKAAEYNKRFQPTINLWQFRNNKTHADDYGLADFMEMNTPKDDVATTASDFTVDIELQPEMRSHCIKSISIVVTRVTGSVFWANSDEDGHNRTDGEIVIDTLTTHADWTIDSELKFEEDGGLFIGSLSIDFRTKIITIS